MFLVAAIIHYKKQQKSDNRPRTPGPFNHSDTVWWYKFPY